MNGTLIDSRSNLTSPEYFLSLELFKDIQNLVDYGNVKATTFWWFQLFISSISLIIVLIIRLHSKVIKFYSLEWLITVSFSASIKLLLEKSSYSLDWRYNSRMKISLLSYTLVLVLITMGLTSKKVTLTEWYHVKVILNICFIRMFGILQRINEQIIFPYSWFLSQDNLLRMWSWQRNYWYLQAWTYTRFWIPYSSW